MTDKTNKRHGYASKTYEDVILCMAASYFTAAFNYDFYISGGIFDVGRYLSLALMLFCWTAMSLTNGLKRRYGFIACAVMWNAGFPFLKWLCVSVRALKFSKAGLAVKDTVMILNEFPYYYLEKRFDISGSVFSVMLAAACLLLFAAGLVCSKRSPVRRESENV